MSDFKSRLVDEFEQLIERVQKLESFMGTEKYEEIDEIHQELLVEQHEHMTGYISVLMQRLELLKEED